MTARPPEDTIAKIDAALPAHLRGVITPAQRHSEHLTEMAANADGYFDFSVADIAALDWALARICKLDTEVVRLRSLRPARWSQKCAKES